MTDRTKRVVTVPATIELLEAQWRDALDQAELMGVTHRAYGDTAETDERLWQRVRDHYNAGVRRGTYVDGKHVPPPPADTLPAYVVGPLLTEARRAYNDPASTAEPLVDLERLAVVLARDGHPTAYVEQTGGGCATLYVGPRWTDEAGDERWTLAIGPGWFDGPGWQHGYASPDELYIGRDDDGTSPQPQVPPGATLREIADMAQARADVTKALIAAEETDRRVARQVLERAAEQAAKRLTWQWLATEDQTEALDAEIQEVTVGGDSDWRMSVTVYRVGRELRVGDTVVPPGTYLRTCDGKRVLCWRVGGVDAAPAAAAYAKAVDALYEADGKN